jgi:SAM-dependent methyltransferase
MMTPTFSDYDAVWQEQMGAFDHASDTAGYWDRRARTYDSPWRNSTYTGELINRLELRPGYSVLDVACGTGVLAIPLAARVHRVTALDISPLMLEILQQRILKSGITNVTIINKDWNDVIIGEDIPGHDVVLVSRSMPYRRLSETLQKINNAAKSACYITWRAERTDDYEASVAKAIGKDYQSYPDYLTIVGMLGKLDIKADIEIFESYHEEKYPSLKEAVLNMARGAKISDSQFVRLFSLANNRLNQKDGYYYATNKLKWALISWHKPAGY